MRAKQEGSAFSSRRSGEGVGALLSQLAAGAPLRFTIVIPEGFVAHKRQVFCSGSFRAQSLRDSALVDAGVVVVIEAGCFTHSAKRAASKLSTVQRPVLPGPKVGTSVCH